MPSNRSKYTEEMREKTAKFILSSDKSATQVAEELGIDTNTVCRWVRDYRRKNNMPSYAEEKGFKKQGPMTSSEEKYKIKELERENKKLKKKYEEEKEKVEILKKSLRIFMEQLE